MTEATNATDPNLNTADATAPETAKAPKVPTLAENMPTRQIFGTLAEALAGWATITAYPDAAGVRPFITGLVADAEGNATIDPEAYPESHEVMIAKLTELGDVVTDGKGNKERQPTRTVALVLHPIPKLETFLGVDSLPAGDGTNELREIIRKEMQHRSVRTLRILKGNYADESAVAEAQDKMPRSLAEFINGTRSGSGLLDAFNKHAIEALRRFANLDGKNKPVAEAFQRAKLSKATLRQALSNAAFALSEYPRLESAGLFLRVMAVLTTMAKAEGLSTTAYESWMETRDAQTYDPTAIDLGSVDLDGLFGGDDSDASPDASNDTAPAA